MGDLLQGVQDAIESEGQAAPSPGPGSLPSMEELLAMLDNLTDISEEERQSLKESLLSGNVLTRGPAKSGPVAGMDPGYQMLVLLSLVALIILVLSFFGYKLYKSLVEKERRREEKRKLKMQKKKK